MNKQYLDIANKLLDYFKKKAKEIHGVDVVINRNKSKYAIAEMLADLSVKQVQDLIDYYMHTYNEPNVNEFCYEYDTIHKEMVTDQQDTIERKSLAEETRRRVEEFRKQYGGKQ